MTAYDLIYELEESDLSEEELFDLYVLGIDEE